MLYEKLILNNIQYPGSAIVDTASGRSLSYLEIHSMVKDTAKKFASFNLRHGDRAVIQSYNTLETVINILACIYMGACFIPVSNTESNERLDYIIENSACSIVVLKDGCKVLRPKTHNISSQTNLTYIIYTSGSTAYPKGVMASEKQVLFCIEAINNCLLHRENDKILCCLPLSFDYGLYQLFMSLYSRAEFLLVQNKGAFLQYLPALMVKYSASVFPAVPTMLNILVQSGTMKKLAGQLQNLRMITSTGENFSVALINEIKEQLPFVDIIPMYGLTECKRVSIIPPAYKNKAVKIQAGSCGLPLPGTSVRLDNGELIISGPNVMAGYWNDPQTTAQYFFDDPYFGWSLRSGDLFRIDSDGFLYFEGRLKHIIKVDGVRLSAFEIESRLKKYFDGNTDIKIISVSDDVHGEKIIACLASNVLSANEIKTILRNSQVSEPNYRKVRGFILLDSMPLNVNGKIDVPLLIETAKNNHVSL